MAKYSVYVIELDPKIRQIQKFRNRNPRMNPLKACFYVGSTWRSPDERYDQHKQGYKSNTYAKKYGLRLRPDLFEPYNPIPSRKDAEELEVYLAQRLRAKGHGVWQG